MTAVADPLASITGAKKAAMFLMGLDDQLSSALLRRLDPDEIRLVSAEISAMQSVSPKEMAFVFREFETLTSSSRLFAKGGAVFARRLVEQALGPESAQKLLTPSDGQDSPGRGDFGGLEKADPKQLADFLRDEQPQTIALLISNLPAAQGSGLMAALPAETRGLVAMRMASLDRMSPQVFRRISEALSSKLKTLKQVDRPDPIRALASVLAQLDPEMSEAILAKVDEEDAAVGSSVRNRMFSFDDIITIDKQGMMALLGKLDRKILTVALKGTTPKLRTHFTQNMSQRAAEMLNEDMEAMGPARIRDVQAAQAQIVAVVRQMQQDGSIAKGSGTDEYVV
jgi:flagellar motor switch protein FliG